VLDELALIAPRTKRHLRFVVIEIISNPGSHAQARRVPAERSWLHAALSGPERPCSTAAMRRCLRAEALARRVLALGGIYVPIRLGQSPTGATRRLVGRYRPWPETHRQPMDSHLPRTGFDRGRVFDPAKSLGTAMHARELGTMWQTRDATLLQPRY